MEDWLSIEIAGDSLGHFKAKCSAVDEAGIGNKLIFSLAFDQAEIPKIVSGLRSIASKFPVIGRPGA